MDNDPFFSAIIKGLSESLDPEAFEECAAAVVRSDFSTAVQVVGGTDGGMDGAIADTEGEAFPIICTTRADVIGNMTGSLRRYVAEGGARRKCVVVTNQQLSARKRTNLERRAQEMGFVLVQIYDQSAVAQRLYRMPEWTRSLLGISGTTSALSTVPHNLRGRKSYGLVGRQDLIGALTASEGDLVVSGEPGSGKTAVLAELAENDWGLFVTDDARDKIADAIRGQQPEIIIVDDAHVRRDLLSTLVSLRSELDANFKIAAVTWPSYRDMIQEELQVPNAQVVVVDRLARNQIAELVRSHSPQFPDWLIQEIVEQAEGLPGVATLLAETVISGDYADVRSGRKLFRQLKRNHGHILSSSDQICIGAIALAGSRGITVRQVSRSTGTSLDSILRLVAELSYGGVVRDIHAQPGGARRVAIRPSRLRSASISAAFLEPPQLIDLREVADAIDDPVTVAAELIDAALTGAVIEFDLLLDYVGRANSTSIWSSFSLLGERHARKAIDALDKQAHVLIPELLVHCPREAISILLERLVHDDRSEGQNSDHPARVITDWIQSAPPGVPEAIDRRKLVIESVTQWLEDGGDRSAGFRVIRSALNPFSEQRGVTPGSGDAYWWRNMSLNEGQLEEINLLWHCVFNLLESPADPRSLLQLTEAANDRLHPRTTSYDDETIRLQKLIRDHTTPLVTELVRRAGDHQGLLAKHKSMGTWLGVDLQITLDDDYSAMYVDMADEYPEFDYLGIEDRVAREFVDRWAARDPDHFFQRVHELEAMSSLDGQPWPNRSQGIANALASAVADPCYWLQTGLDAQINDVWLFSLLSECARGDACEESIRQYLDNERLAPALVAEVLRIADPPEDLVAWAVDWIEANAESLFLELFIRANEVSVRAVSKLLDSSSPLVRWKAAVGEWLQSPEGEVRTTLLESWRAAMLECPESSHYLYQILQTDSTLAKEWLETRITRGELILVSGSGLVNDIAENLSTSDRVELLRGLPDTHWPKEFLNVLVGYDPAVFDALLDSALRTDQRLAPLMDFSHGTWLDLLGIAEGRGFTSAEVAGAIAYRARGWSGRASNYWQTQLEELNVFSAGLVEGGRSPFALSVIDTVIRLYQAELDRAKEHDRHEDVFGY